MSENLFESLKADGKGENLMEAPLLSFKKKKKKKKRRKKKKKKREKRKKNNKQKKTGTTSL